MAECEQDVLRYYLAADFAALVRRRVDVDVGCTGQQRLELGGIEYLFLDEPVRGVAAVRLQSYLRSGYSSR